MPSSLLPNVLDDNHYSTLFKQNAIWKPAIDKILEIHGLTKPAIRGEKGSHIVYRSGDVWIKLMAPIYAGDMDYELSCLQSLYGHVSFATPRVQAEGEIESWRYVLMSHVEGERVGDHFLQMTTAEQVSLAIEFAQATRAMQRIAVPKKIAERSDWNLFIRGQYEKIYETHRQRGLPEIWLASLESFVHQLSLSEFTVLNPVFLHSDLTWDHFLIKKENDRWRLSGIIDFADAQSGHSEYDMCASMAFLFRHKKDVITAYSREMGMKETGSSLSRKLMIWTLLHRFSNLNNYFAKDMIERPNGDFSELADLVYPAY